MLLIAFRILQICAFFACIFFFVRAFKLHASLALRLMHEPEGGLSPRRTAANASNFQRFMAGELYPELRPKWGRAVLHAVLSFALFFLLSIPLAILAD